jgi:hypothetical protein
VKELFMPKKGVTPKPKAPRKPPRFEQVPPEQAKKILDAVLDVVMATSGGALKELEKY